MARREVVVHETHRGLLFRDGALADVLEPGRYQLVSRRQQRWLRRPVEDVVMMDVRERELTIKGQEILTADKVAIRVTIITNFRVVDAKAAYIMVESYYDRIYSDVQLAARRSLASMTLDEILTNRNKLSDDILQDVAEGASEYGVGIRRAHVKDLIFPGNLQEIMNRVLATERRSEAERVEAHTNAETSRIAGEAQAAERERMARTAAEAVRISAEADAEATRIKAAAERDALRERLEMAQTYESHPSLLRLRELETLGDLGRNANARLYVGADKALDLGSSSD